MGGTTPISALPYPTGTDRVADGDNAIQALATALDEAAASSAGAGIVPGASVTIGAGGVWRRGKLGVFSMDTWQTSAQLAALATICTLPAGYRPLAATRFLFMNTANTTVGLGIVNPSGIIQTALLIPTGAFLNGTVTFPMP